MLDASTTFPAARSGLALRVSIFDFATDTDRPEKILGTDATFTSPHFPGLEFAAKAIFTR